MSNLQESESISDSGSAFKEVLIKSNISNNYLKSYFNISKGEYSILNSFSYDENTFIISGFVLLNILYLEKINLNKTYENKENEGIELDCDYDDVIKRKINEIFEFFYFKEDKKIEKFEIESIIIIKELRDFCDKFLRYFTEIVKKLKFLFNL
jgi:hypothetical protein